MQHSQNWPHSPPHRVLEEGTYMITAGTYEKILHFNSSERLQFLHDSLLELANEYGWKLQAWAVFANHYHFIAKSPGVIAQSQNVISQSQNDPKNLSTFISHFHSNTAKYVNSLDKTLNRRVWFQFWDSHITYQYSYLARLNYVNQNPVLHGLVEEATQYPWCSASWFKNSTLPSFYKTVSTFKTDKVNVVDNF